MNRKLTRDDQQDNYGDDLGDDLKVVPEMIPEMILELTSHQVEISDPDGCPLTQGSNTSLRLVAMGAR